MAMTTYHVSIRGLNEAMRRLDTKKLGPAMRRGMERAVSHLEGEVKERTPVRTGRLRASITKRVSGSGKHVEGRIGTNVAYARYVEEGTRPHEIRAVRARALRFQAQGQGRAFTAGGRLRARYERRIAAGRAKATEFYVFRRRVQHPGTKGARMFGRAWAEEGGEKLLHFFRHELEQAYGGQA